MTSDQTTDPWAWAHVDPDPAGEPAGAADVVAVMVAHNGDLWLGRTLVELARLTQRPGRIVAVDAGSTDGTRNLLTIAQNEGIIDEVVEAKGEEGFGAAVNAALATAPLPDDGWIWLLHDDLEPRHNALSELLRAAATPPEGEPLADILVPKLLHPRMRNRPDQMGEIGESISATGERVVSVEHGDIDQRQDEPARVLGASTAGLFIKVDAWEQLGGLNPAIPLFRDGVDLGWRANAAGLVVRTAPEAGLYHHRAGRLGIRDSDIVDNPDVEDRLAGMRVVAAHSANPGRTKIGLTLASLGKAFGMLLGKSPSGARDQLTALRRFRKETVAPMATDTGATTVPTALLPGPTWGIRRTADRLAGAVTDRYRDFRDDDPETSIDELTSDDFGGRSVQARLLSPLVLGLILALLGTLVASRSVLGFGELTSLRLLPAPSTLAEAWDAWMRPTAGLAGANAPWLGVMALGSTLMFGQPNLFASLLILGGPALAAWSAHEYLRRRLPRAGWQAMGLAGLWGLMLPALSVTSHGMLDVTIAAIVIPRLASALNRWRFATTTGADGLRAPGAVALWVALLTSLFPLAWVAAAVVIALVALSRRDLRGGIIAIVLPLVALVSWFPRLFAEPGRLLTGIDPAAFPATEAASTWQAALGRTAGSTTPLGFSIAIVALVLAIGLASLALLPADTEPRARRVFTGIAVIAPVIGIVLTRLVVTIAGVPVRPDGRFWTLVGLWALISLGGLLARATAPRPIIDEADADDARNTTLRRAFAGLIAIAVAVAGAWWLVGGGGAPLQRADDPLPSYVRNVHEAPRFARTLMVDLVDGVADYSLVSATQPQWGSGEASPLFSDDDASLALAEVTQQFAEGQPSDDLAERLGELGIAHVWVRGATDESISSLANTNGLVSAAAAEDTVIWTVADLPSRASVRSAGSDVTIPDGRVPAGTDGRTLVLAEVADSGWTARLNGTRLDPTESGDWRAAFTLPAEGGELTWSMRPHWVGIITQVLALALMLVLAAPSANASTAGPRRALPETTRRRAR